MKIKPRSLTLLFFGWLLISTACKFGSPKADPAAVADQPNPASVYCEQHAGRLEIRDGENGQAGACLFPDGSECDEWLFYRGECQPATRLTETAAEAFPPELLAARAAALAHVQAQDGDLAPPAGLVWVGRWFTRSGDSEPTAAEFTAGSWRLRLSFALPLPEHPSYRIAIDNQTTSYHWQGEVD